MPNISEYIKYLGAPIAAKKNSRVKFAGLLIEHIRIQLSRIKASGITLAQKFHAIKAHLIPQMDHLIRVGQIPLKSFKKLDREIRGAINNDLIRSPLPKPIFYTDWHDGGFSLPCLHQRQLILQIATFTSLCNSPNEEVREWTQTFSIERSHFPRHQLRRHYTHSIPELVSIR